MTSDVIRGCLWMLGSIVAFTLMAIAGRQALETLDTFEIMLFRSIVGFLIVVLTARVTGHLHEIRTRRIGLHFIRNASHFAGQNLWFFALGAIPLAQVFAFEFTTPLWVAVLAPFVLGDRLNRLKLFAVILGFCGILLVAQPGSSPISAGLIAAALAAVGFAGSVMATKLLTRTETVTCILFYLTLMQAVFGLLLAGYDGDIAVPEVRMLPAVLTISLCGLLAHFCITKALSLASATVVIPVDFLRLPVIAIVGAVLYGEALTIAVVIGSVVILLANAINLKAEASKA